MVPKYIFEIVPVKYINSLVNYRRNFRIGYLVDYPPPIPLSGPLPFQALPQARPLTFAELFRRSYHFSATPTILPNPIDYDRSTNGE